MQGEFLAGTFGCVRQLRDQLEPASREGRRLPIGKPADVVFRSQLKIPYGLPVVGSPLKVHRKFRCDFSGVLTVELLRLLADSPVQLDAPGCGHPLIQYVLIQNVYEAVPRHGFSRRQVLNTTILNKLTLASQFTTPRFYDLVMLSQSSCNGEA